MSPLHRNRLATLSYCRNWLHWAPTAALEPSTIREIGGIQRARKDHLRLLIRFLHFRVLLVFVLGGLRGHGTPLRADSPGAAGDFYSIDYRLHDRDTDGNSKYEHIRELLLRAIADKRIQGQTVLFDWWYAGADNP